MDYEKKIVFRQKGKDPIVIFCTADEESKLKQGLFSTKPGAVIPFPKGFNLKHFNNCESVDFEDTTWHQNDPIREKYKGCKNWESDTGANVCNNCGYSLIRHPEAVEKLIEEMPEKVNHRPLAEDIYNALECTQELTKEFIRITLKDIKVFDGLNHRVIDRLYRK